MFEHVESDHEVECRIGNGGRAGNLCPIPSDHLALPCDPLAALWSNLEAASVWAIKRAEETTITAAEIEKLSLRGLKFTDNGPQPSEPRGFCGFKRRIKILGVPNRLVDSIVLQP